MSTSAAIQIPPIRGTLADTHAHLDMLDDPGGALARAALAGVAFVVTVVDPTEDAERTFAELDGWRSRAREMILSAYAAAEPHLPPMVPQPPDVHVIVGVHPHNAKEFDPTAERALLEFADRPLTVGIGEIGLDFHYDRSPRDVQGDVFAEQLGLAARLDLPAVVHLREAHEEGLAIMREVGIPPSGCVLHCFTGDAELVEGFLDAGCYISFAGPVTFKKADAIREAAARVPLDRLLVETDCPFMTPEPYRGRPNEPGLTVFTARRIAEARDIAEDELTHATYQNARRLFGERQTEDG